MPIDPSIIGQPLGSLSVFVDPWRLSFYAGVIGEEDPVYHDEGAARAAGLPGCPVPPAYFACLATPLRGQFALWERLGIRVQQILHGEQGFTYYRPAYSGDTLTFTTRIDGVELKKAGAMELVRLVTEISNGAAQPVAQQRATLIIRHDLAGLPAEGAA